MHDLKPVPALGGSTLRVDTFNHVTISENDDFALASVAARLAREAETQSILEDLLGALPDPGKAVFHDPHDGFWMGPDQWMIVASKLSHEGLADDLKARFDDAASITEQSGAWVCFDLVGTGVNDVSERLCAVPVRRMDAGDAQRSVIHQLGCFVILCEKDQHIRIFGPRASAGTLHHALVTAARSTA